MLVDVDEVVADGPGRQTASLEFRATSFVIVRMDIVPVTVDRIETEWCERDKATAARALIAQAAVLLGSVVSINGGPNAVLRSLAVEVTQFHSEKVAGVLRIKGC